MPMPIHLVHPPVRMEMRWEMNMLLRRALECIIWMSCAHSPRGVSVGMVSMMRSILASSEI